MNIHARSRLASGRKREKQTKKTMQKREMKYKKFFEKVRERGRATEIERMSEGKRMRDGRIHDQN